MRVGIVYTSTTPELIETVNTELKKQLGEDVEFLNYEDPSILAEVRDAGFVTAGAAARLVTMFMQAVQDGAGYWQHYLQRWNRQNIRLREWPGSLENR